MVNGSGALVAQPDLNDCADLISRIEASRHFRKSARQKQLLRYLWERAGEAEDREIHEQEIGAAVFGRPSGYDTSVDNIVRVNVYDLRKRLEAFFSSDGHDEPFRIEIPRGGYRPALLTNLDWSAPVAPEPPAAIPAIVHKASNAWFFKALSGVLAIACIVLLVRNDQLAKAPSQPSPDHWTRIFPSARPTTVVVADSNFSFLQDVLRKPLPAKDYFNDDYLSGARNSDIPGLEKQNLEMLMSRRYTSFADVNVLRRVVQFAGPAAPRVRTNFARDFRAEDLKTSNVILLGSKRSNPWQQLFEDDLNFRFRHDEANGHAEVINAHPKPGEQPVYTTSRDTPTLTSYGVIALLPNPGRTGNVLIIQGTDMQGTDAAGEFIFNPNRFSEFLRSVGVPPNGPVPYFEVLIKATTMGAANEPPRMVSYRLLPPTTSKH